MLTLVASSFLEGSGIPISIGCAFGGLVFAFYLIRSILALSPGNERMRQIASAIEEGAKAYLNRQLTAVSMIAVVLVVLIGIFRDSSTALGFVIGAVCSLLAGFVGMRI